MNLEETKQSIEVVEDKLHESVFVTIHLYERNGRKLNVAITSRLRTLCKRGRIWKSKQMLTALKNAQYGFDINHAHSPGGSDGIFILSRDYKPKNEMMKKIFDKYLDKPGSGAAEIAEKMKTSLNKLIPVRLVSHHMRLLGVLKLNAKESTLVLVDYDDTK